MFQKKVKTIYLIGIKGTGMSSLAVLLKKLGYRVGGSDSPELFFTQSQLKAHRIPYHEGFRAGNVLKARPDLVVASTAYTERNPEVAQAKLSRIPLLSYPQAVGAISRDLISVAVCGSHGKTTTTSMLGWIMQSNGRTATLAGTVAPALNHTLARPQYFIFEADEYQNKFQYFAPANVILTNVDYDHPDYFTSRRQYRKVFKDFIARTLKRRGFVLYNEDDPQARSLTRSLPAGRHGARDSVASYGFSPKSDYRIAAINGGLDHFAITYQQKPFAGILLKVYGRHNILNAAASAIMAVRLGISRSVAERRLRSFSGVKRRMEAVPSAKYTLIDDYGHHPTEIRATLAALRARYPAKQIVTVFHPHTFSRTKTLLKDFGRAFRDSDLTVVLDIYPSARETTGDIHARDLVREITKHKSRALYRPGITDAAAYIKKHVTRGSVVLTIGAGDVWKLCHLIQ